MHKRTKRMVLIAVLLAVVSVAVLLALKAFEENLLYYYSTSDVIQGKASNERNFRLGGMVLENSVKRNGLQVAFTLTDYETEIVVHYQGILPDLFREGQGVVTTGRLTVNRDVFQATEVLAKHDENYMPPEVAASLKYNNKQSK